MIATKQQLIQTIDALSARHKKVLDDFTNNKFIPVSAEEIISVSHSMNALECYNNTKKRYQSV